MLKIIDGVDLKELEKFGFEYRELAENCKIYTYIRNDGFDGVSDLKTISSIDIFCDSREINAYKFIMCNEKHETSREMKGLEVLFNIIQAGLVEKV